MGAPTLPAVYETYEGHFGQKSTLDALIAEIAQYDRDSLLWICAEIVCQVQLWSRPAGHNRSNYMRYLTEFFELGVSKRLISGASSTMPVRLLFHRRQIGLVAKLAVKHCGSGLDARSHRAKLGLLFLMANDHLDYGLLRDASQGGGNVRDRYLRLVTEMVSGSRGFIAGNQ